ncbi:hypothetical protein [Natrononativus amylolyticus]|uniref:hypothetical protein n=1 Tax=Natrononativus amylolyticus TaxID=2963434 RepID=UPI0020CE8CCB|nr:hypothetical protein [Natrononativus amylolyticus]
MALDKHVAEQRRFARLLGTDSDRSGLPVGAAVDEAELDVESTVTAGNDVRSVSADD